jgi:hypothetical protein
MTMAYLADTFPLVRAQPPSASPELPTLYAAWEVASREDQLASKALSGIAPGSAEYAAAAARSDQAVIVQTDLEDRICMAPAHSICDAVMKLRVSRHVLTRDDEIEEDCPELCAIDDVIAFLDRQGA